MKTISSAAQARRKVLTFALTTRRPVSRRNIKVLGTDEADDRLLEALERSPGRCYSLEEVAAVSGLSKRTIRHIEDRALLKLAEAIGSQWSPDDIQSLLNLGFSGPSR